MYCERINSVRLCRAAVATDDTNGMLHMKLKCEGQRFTECSTTQAYPFEAL